MRGWMILMAGAVALAGCGKQAARQDLYGAGQCGGLAPGWLRPEQRGFRRDPMILWLSITRKGLLLWDGQPVDEHRVMTDLKQASQIAGGLELNLIFDERTPCDTVIRIRHLFFSKTSCGREQRCVEYEEGQWQKERSLPPPAPVSSP